VISENNRESVGHRIRRLRLERGLSLRDLASPGVSYTYLSRVEGGHRTPSVKAIRQIARKLGVSAEYVETGFELDGREELELALADVELSVRLEPERREGEAQLRRIVERAEDEGASDLAARARASLGMALAGWGRLEEAARQLERALADPSVCPSVFTEAYVSLATTYEQLGLPKEAARVCEDGLAHTPAEDGAARIVLGTYLSYALADIGEYSEAEHVLAEFVEPAAGADPYHRARLHWSLARVDAMQDKRRDALRHMRKAITLLAGREDTVLVARAHWLCAEILVWGGRLDGVASHLRAALEVLPAQASNEDRVRLDSIRALYAARTRDIDEARTLAEQALAAASEPNPAATFALALVAASARAFERADELFAQTLALLEARSLWREASLVAQDRATALAAAGNERDAERWWRAADDYAARVTAKLARR
jgi:transcriptional regulator with XRE-family HTH domain